jgi:hypothetical protein
MPWKNSSCVAIFIHEFSGKNTTKGTQNYRIAPSFLYREKCCPKKVPLYFAQQNINFKLRELPVESHSYE